MTTTRQLRSRFLAAKDYLDEVFYSLIRTTDHDLADELFLQLKEDHASFAHLARVHSEGPERLQGGMIGPVPLAQAHPYIVDRLKGAKPGEIFAPFWVKEFSVILRLDDLIPSRFAQAQLQLA